jgi:YegS/Rv2252/BmrU family lipid kinase
MEYFNNNRTILIINPNAGMSRLAFLKRNLWKYRDELDYTTFEDIQQFRSFMRKNIGNYDIFIAAGGDGTVNSLATELKGTEKILGVLPVGSGNGFAREMGFRKDIETMVESVRKKDIIDIDVLSVNNVTCINVAGIGLDSYVAHDFHGLEKRGFWNYAITSFRIAFTMKPFKIWINIEGEKREEDLYMLSIANTRQFGNNALIVPGAFPNDGLFNIALVKPMPPALIPFFVVKMMTGTLSESKYLKYIATGNKITVRSEETRYHVDGEPLNFQGEVEVTISKGSLKVLRTKHTRWK